MATTTNVNPTTPGQAIYDELEGRVGVFENLQPYPDCSTLVFSRAGWNANDYNCAVTVCPMVENPRILYSDIRTGISTVRAVCERTNSGGQDVYDDQFVVEVASNPDYDTSPVTIGSIPDNNDKREAGEEGTTERLHQRDFVTKRQSPDVSTQSTAMMGGGKIFIANSLSRTTASLSR